MAWCRRIISRIAEEGCDPGFFSLRTWVLDVPSRGTFSLFSELQRRTLVLGTIYWGHSLSTILWAIALRLFSWALGI